MWWLCRGWQAGAGLGDFVRIVELNKEVEILLEVLRTQTGKSQRQARAEI